VLTKPGLEGIVASVREGRVTFQRILTYTLNSITKKIVQVLFLSVGLLITGHAILTPMLMVIIMLTGDLLGMSLATDNVRPSPRPNSWHIGALTAAGAFMGVAELGFCTAVLVCARLEMGSGIENLRSVAFIAIVFGGQATTYTNRERLSLISSRPSRWLVGTSVMDVLVAAALAASGIAMTRIPLAAIGAVLAGAVAFAFLLDLAKVPILRRLGLT
jgi:H+-transporting ATPase